MPFFPCAHASHPLWQHAVKQVVVQLRAQIHMQELPRSPALGVVYISEVLASHAAEIVRALTQALPEVRHWVGSAVLSVLGGDMDYGQSGALAVMLPFMDEGDYHVFSDMGASTLVPQRLHPQRVLVHGEASDAALGRAVHSLSQRLGGAALSGGLCRLSGRLPQVAWSGQALAPMPASIGGSGVQVGGLSGIAFGENVRVLHVGMQAVKPIGAWQSITAAEGDWLLALNGQPALPALLQSMGLDGELLQFSAQPSSMWAQMRQTLLCMQPGTVASEGIRPSGVPRIGRVVAVDALRQAVCLDSPVITGQALALCAYDEATARLDMRRACAELWEELTSDVAYVGPVEQEHSLPTGSCICGAIYVRSQQRVLSSRMPHLDDELQLIRHALGPVPLIGFASSCEVEGEALQHLSAQLIVFVQPLHGWS